MAETKKENFYGTGRRKESVARVWLKPGTGQRLVNQLPWKEYFERDVFLDNSKNINEIRKAMDLLIKEANQKGYAVGIGHIQTRELAQVLKEYYNKKEQLGVEFVPLKKLK